MRALIKANGFTLLELMLVLVLLTTLAMAGLAMYQIQLRNFRVDKTALQMQQWMQAGLAFYVDCHQWPDPIVDPDIMNKMMGIGMLTSDDCQNQDYQGKVRTYMPKGSDQNGPWGNSYYILLSPDKNLFYIETSLGRYTSRLYNAAQMIAARLPEGKTSAQFLTYVRVKAAVGKPASAIVDTSRGFILNMQTVNSDQVSKIKLPANTDCPSGMVPDVEVAPVQFHAGQTNNMDMVGTTYAGLNGNIYPVVKGATWITPPFQPGYYQYNTSGRVLVITACLPQQYISTKTKVNTTNLSAMSRF